MMDRGPEIQRADRRLVFVTGGSRGIGRAIVVAFAALGDHVVALGRDELALQATVELAGKAGATNVGYDLLDVTNPQAVASFFTERDVDILVNNAGISTSAPLERTSLHDWNRNLAVNATGSFLCTQAVINAMRKRGSGRIVMIASTAAHVGYRYTSAYTASKHALVGLTRALAAELGNSGITANAVCPSFVRTEMTLESISRIVETTGRSVNEAETALAEASPLGRLLEPTEVAAVVIFLASQEAACINGQAIIMDGGGVHR